MLDPRDLYTNAQSPPLASGTERFGTSLIQYEMRKYQDIRNLSNEHAYLLICKHRIIIPNGNPYEIGPSDNTSYSDYPAAITNVITLTVDNNDATILLKDFFPRTLNAAVSTSANTSEANSVSDTTQYSSGSSTAQSNSYGVSVSTSGILGNLLKLGATHSHETQSTIESGNFSSAASGTALAQQSDQSSGESMSIKDWSSYGFTDQTDGSATWIWGQAYPWDVILYNQGTSSGIKLPEFVQARMVTHTKEVDDIRKRLLLPPSQLSLFGVDFTMQAGWVIKFPKGISKSATATVKHTTTYYTASHSLSAEKFSATLQTPADALTSEFTSSKLDLSTYALDPILSAGRGNGAAIGFTANPFVIAPTTAGTFLITSPANNLQVTGTGFGPTMSTDFPQSQTVSLTIQCKILDSTNEYSLLLMHWIGPNSGPCKLTIMANGRAAGVIYVDAVEGQGGQDNVTAVGLRNTDFSSTSYHDYLVIGLNTISIAVVAVNPSPNQYTLFALGIGKA
jgi:hypothetical protein